MREIKFRAWDKEHRKMIYALNHYLYYCGIIRAIGDENWSAPSENYVLMQYTGLKDKNGQEIYERDIVVDDWYPEEPHPISFPLDGAYRIEYMPPCWRCSLVGGRPEENQCFDDFDDMKVIGNIYENPELLTDVAKEAEDGME